MKKIFIKLLLFSLSIFYSSVLIAQSTYIDSLKKVLQTEKEDTNKVNTLYYICDNYFYSYDYENAIQNAKAMLALSEKLSNKIGIADSYLEMGLAYSIKNDQITELGYFKKALDLYAEIGNKESMINCYDRMAYAYSIQENFGKITECRYAAQKIREQTGNKKMIADGFYNVATAVNYSADSYNSEEALKNADSALKLYKELKNKKKIGSCYSLIGTVYTSQQKYTEALDIFAEALQIFKDMKITEQMALVYLEIEIAYEKQGDSSLAKQNKIEAVHKYNLAEDAELNALHIWRNEIPINMAACFSGLGQIDIKLGKLTLAKNYLDSSLVIYKPYVAYYPISEIYNNLSKIDSINRNYKDAYENYKLFHIYSDSVKTKENTKATVQAQMKYDFDKKEAISKAEQDKQNADQKRIKNQQLFTILALGILVVAVIIIALIQFRNNKQKQKANLLLERQKQKIETTLSELKSTQSQLIQSEKMASLGELTAGIAHEIQNPLNFVNNFSDVNQELLTEMKDELDKGNISDAKLIADDVIENSQKINHHGKRADAIVKGMLQHSRSSTSQKELTDINKLADEYLRLAYHGLRAKDNSFNATMKTEFDEGLQKINIIPQDFGRVLLNLYNNAFYAVAEKSKLPAKDLSGFENLTGLGNFQPTITVNTKKSDNHILITVSDNGNGIPQKVVDKIFQPFFTTKPTGQGTGLGLSLSYDIIKAHGGEIKVNTKEGEGTEFIIQLPIA